MVEIIKASEMGFCMGVRRAVDMMQAASNPENPIFSVGEIVHNPRVVEQLRQAGVRQLPGPDEIDGDVGAATVAAVQEGRVAITAHGVGQAVNQSLNASGLQVIDTTCPIVTRAQRYAQKFVREGLHVLIFGDPQHKEVRGIVGWAHTHSGTPAVTVFNRFDRDSLRELMESFPNGFPNKIGVMAQTTHKIEDFAQFVSNLMLLQRDYNFEMHVVNTLCHATTGQQEAAAALASTVDVMIVVGGRKSANTRNLREVCEEQGTPSYHVEDASEIEAEWFAAARRVGLTAGASTPDESVDTVEARIHELTAGA